MKKGILIAVAVLVALVGGVWVTGMLMSEKHSAVVTVRLAQPPAAVWAAIADFQAWPTWNKALARMERLGDVNGHPVWRLTDENGSMTSEVTTAVPPEGARPGRLVTKVLPGDGDAFGGTWTYDVAAAEGGTAVTITEDGEIYDPFFRVLARFVFGYTGSAEGYLRYLGAKFGESAVPAVVRAM